VIAIHAVVLGRRIRVDDRTWSMRRAALRHGRNRRARSFRATAARARIACAFHREALVRAQLLSSACPISSLFPMLGFAESGLVLERLP
jgi:hypothetical protein